MGADDHKRTLFLAIVLLCSACDKHQSTQQGQVSAKEFVGSQTCQGCHETAFDEWRGSHHELAMQVATTETVAANFSDVNYEYFGTRTRFLNIDGRFVVRTENGEGEQQDFTVTHTFGVDPLQQYLVDMPGGRKQALPFTWDNRPVESGGQHWYHLYPDEHITPDDPLHWTGPYFNWNTMCAECHSSDLNVGYNFESDTFETTFNEVSVGCEACHGPASSHVAQAQSNTFKETFGFAVNLDDRDGASWIMNAETGIAERDPPAKHQQQVESCGRCHSRRSTLSSTYEYGKALTDTHMPSLLEENLYFADGRIQDEVYVYGSFVQSKMYAAGVSCTDCHNPHSGQLITGPEPNNICSQCHLPAKFAAPDHSGNSPDCVACHMPATIYMGIDDRRDHSFRVPNAGEMQSHYGQAIAAGRFAPSDPVLLTALAHAEYPAIARATILTLLSPVSGHDTLAALKNGLDDVDPLVRIAALRSLRRGTAESRLQYGSHLLDDPIRGVRIEAALTYTELRDLLPIDAVRSYAGAADEYREAMLANASSPDAMIRLAEFESRNGNNAAADRYFGHAIRLDTSFAAARHAYGLFLVRSKRSDNALQQLRTAAMLAPDNSRYAYVLGVALNSMGQTREALDALTQSRTNFPDDFDIAWALATTLRDAGEIGTARSLAAELRQQFPGNSHIAALQNELKTGKSILSSD